MYKKVGNLTFKSIIASILVLATVFVYVIGDNFSFMAYFKNDKTVENTIFDTGYDGLRSVSDLTLAETGTEMGKIGEDLSSGFEKLVSDCSNKKTFSDGKSEFIELVSDLKKRSLSELDSTNNGTEEYENYRALVVSGFNEIEGYVNQLNEDNSEEILGMIEDTVNFEQPYVGLADDLPFSNVAVDEVKEEKFVPERSASSYTLENTGYNGADLEQTNDTTMNDDVRGEFSEFESVLDIYQYIKNNYTMEFYFGSRKGAVGASAEKAGNDYDIASVLIGVLRDRNIPARYAKGTIEITAEQAMEWTATDDINVAMRIIASLGISTTSMISNGEVVAVQLEHVWVEAYVPYTDYRGTGNCSGESMWIPLDASFKKSVYNYGVKVNEIQEYLDDPDNTITSSTELYGVNIGSLVDTDGEDNSALVKYMLANGYGECTTAEAFGGATIVSEDLGYLPLTLPYGNVTSVESFDDISNEETDSVTFRLFGNTASGTDVYGSDYINYTYLAPDVYGKRIVLSYVPATQADQDIINNYGDIFSAPAYLIKMKPQLSINDEVVAEGGICNAGYSQKFNVTIRNGAPFVNDSDFSNIITVGGMYCLAMDYGNISGVELEAAADYIDSWKSSVSESNIYSKEVMGGMLYAISKLYFGQLDLYNRVLAGQTDVFATRALSLGIVGFKVNVQTVFNRPTELNEGGFYLDIAHDVHSVVSIKNSNEDEKAFMLQAGIYASAMEHGVLEQVTGIESVSTIKTFQYAKEHNIPMHMICSENYGSEINAINVSENVKQEIRNAVNSGKAVFIPENEISINDWNGVGYMVLDLDTCSCGYMISGGTSGGAMTAFEVIDEYITYVYEGIFTIILYELAKAAIMAALPFGWIGVAFTVVEISMLLIYIGSIINLFVQFKATNDVRFLQEALIQIAAGLTIAAIMPSIKEDLEDMKAGVTELVNSLKSTPEYPTTPGGCFIAGTLISTPKGQVPIEKIKVGDIVWSFDETTLEVSENTVENTFVRQNDNFVKITAGNETITATSNHPFYVVTKGFVEAIDLRAGDILITVNGDRLVVNEVQHEILESPIDVFNFAVGENHTYFVGNNAVGVHNNNPCVVEKPVKPEAAVKGSKKHGVNWKEGPSRAKATGKPQGQWALEDLNYATEKANTLKPHESGTFDLPKGSKSIVHMPDGTTKPATKFWIRNNGTGTWHGYPME